MAENAEFTTGDADDELVVNWQNRCRVGFTALRITVDRLPDFLAGLGVESDDSRVGLVEEDLAVSISQTTVNRVTAHHGDDRGVLLGLVLPENAAGLFQVERVHIVRERSVEIHGIADNEWRTFVTAQNTRRERPSDLEVLDVVGVDLIELRITLVRSSHQSG